MTKEEWGMYEAPSIAEYISWRWAQTILGRYIAWKVNRKWKRYQFRLTRDKFFNNLLSKQGKE